MKASQVSFFGIFFGTGASPATAPASAPEALELEPEPAAAPVPVAKVTDGPLVVNTGRKASMKTAVLSSKHM